MDVDRNFGITALEFIKIYLFKFNHCTKFRRYSNKYNAHPNLYQNDSNGNNKNFYD